MKAIVLVFALAVFSLACAAQDKDIPSLDGLTGTGCDIEGYSTGAYHVHIWADYLDKHKQEKATHGWVRLYSIRSSDKASKNRDKAFADCDKWMAKIQELTGKKNIKKAKAATEADSSNGKRR